MYDRTCEKGGYRFGDVRMPLAPVPDPSGVRMPLAPVPDASGVRRRLRCEDALAPVPDVCLDAEYPGNLRAIVNS